MTNLTDPVALLLAILALLIAGLLIYLILLLSRVESALWRVTRALRPEVRRDGNGRRLYERFGR